MVDEKLDDQVWVTVVATGYGDEPAGARGARDGRRVEARDRRVAARARRRAAGEPRARPRRGVRRLEFDVPEFIPRS